MGDLQNSLGGQAQDEMPGEAASMGLPWERGRPGGEPEHNVSHLRDLKRGA